MMPTDRYKQLDPFASTQVELMLVLLSKTIFRIECACEAIEEDEDDFSLVFPHITTAQLVIFSLAEPLNPDGSQVALNLVSLYDYVLECLRVHTLEKLRSAVSVLATLRDGFDKVKDKARALERAGKVKRRIRPPRTHVHG